MGILFWLNLDQTSDKMKSPNFLLLIILLLVVAKAFPQETIYDLIIERAKIIDGTGEPAFFGNLLIRKGIIVGIERDTSKVHDARKKIQAKGKVLSPDFIDTHAHGDPLETPHFENFLAMGVTSICLGQDGFSPNEADLNHWMEKVTEHSPAVNIAMFVGHNTLRELSGVGFDTIPNPGDMDRMQELLR